MAPSAIDIMLDEVYGNMKKEFENIEKDISDCKAIFRNRTPNAW